MIMFANILGYVLLALVLVYMSLFLFHLVQEQNEAALIRALKDFIIAIDDGEPEKLSGAYVGAAEALERYPEDD